MTLDNDLTAAQDLMRVYYEDKPRILEAIKGFPITETGYDFKAFDCDTTKAPLFSTKLELLADFHPVLSRKRLYQYSRFYQAYHSHSKHRASVESGLSGVRGAVNADLILNQHRIAIESALRNNSGRDLSGNVDYASVERKIARYCKSPTLGWPIVPVVLLVAAALAEPKVIRAEQLPTWGDYERVCLKILCDVGFEAKLTSAGADFGADIVGTKDHRTYVIQCKLYSRAVGLAAVQEVIASRSHYGADFAVVCAESGFTLAAINLAATNEVHLTDSLKLHKIMDAWP